MRIPEKNISAPWRDSYGVTPSALDYREDSMYAAIEAASHGRENTAALSYMNRDYTYSTMLTRIDEAARSFISLGVKKGERVLLCLPNTPQAVYCLYALNRIGASASLIHPLSAEGEIRHALMTIKSRIAVVFDGAYEKFVKLVGSTSLKKIVFTSPADELIAPMRIAYQLTSGR